MVINEICFDDKQWICYNEIDRGSLLVCCASISRISRKTWTSSLTWMRLSDFWFLSLDLDVIRCSWFIPLIIKNNAIAIIISEISAWINFPYRMTTGGWFLYTKFFILIVKLLKSTPPKISPKGGVITSSTKDWTTWVNAVPMIIPIARSSTLPRKANLFVGKQKVKTMPMKRLEWFVLTF